MSVYPDLNQMIKYLEQEIDIAKDYIEACERVLRNLTERQRLQK